MRKLLLTSLALVLLMLSSCRSYTIADGRKNILVPESVSLPETKLDNTEANGIEENILFINVGEDLLDNTKCDNIVNIINDISPDVVVLTGLLENQKKIRSSFDSVYEIENTTFILSDRLSNTDTIELLIEDMPAILAKTEISILSSF